MYGVGWSVMYSSNGGYLFDRNVPLRVRRTMMQFSMGFVGCSRIVSLIVCAGVANCGLSVTLREIVCGTATTHVSVWMRAY